MISAAESGSNRELEIPTRDGHFDSEQNMSSS
eukprot:CAMPEP_0201984596 /NCGR_PEP_ID=MMETSP0904-20121228/84052_1 /ASSEMBLY_ACC=CAM_ASM_000553 /TAXON_ID=420261 /ORGANISM="Thalassiosira antarctica, Strain CCMP982" /LENGTH=31 /DNA_ID= /DNA_START= /DNA_END= /DNA_ORIENTATION=